MPRMETGREFCFAMKRLFSELVRKSVVRRSASADAALARTMNSERWSG